jgi:hypothetical protein
VDLIPFLDAFALPRSTAVQSRIRRVSATDSGIRPVALRFHGTGSTPASNFAPTHRIIAATAQSATCRVVSSRAARRGAIPQYT